MRAPVTSERLRVFMREMAKEANEPGRVYITGGASAVVRGWRETTVDVDIKIIPESDRVLRALPDLKERLNVNVELASPADFVPPLPNWEERSPLIERIGVISFHHFDFYSQCLSKLERGHRKDIDDVAAMVREQLVEPKRLLTLFRDVESQLYRYPAIDPATLRARVEAFALQ